MNLMKYVSLKSTKFTILFFPEYDNVLIKAILLGKKLVMKYIHTSTLVYFKKSSKDMISYYFKSLSLTYNFISKIPFLIFAAILIS